MPKSRSLLLASLVIPLALGWKLIDVASWRPKDVGIAGQDAKGQKFSRGRWSEALTITFSPDSKVLAVARQESQGMRVTENLVEPFIELWDVANRALIKVIDLPTARISSDENQTGIGSPNELWFSKDNRLLLMKGQSGIGVLDVATGRFLWTRKTADSLTSLKAPYEKISYTPIGFISDGTKVLYAVEHLRSKPVSQLHRTENIVFRRHKVIFCHAQTGQTLRQINLEFGERVWPRLYAMLSDNRTLVCSTLPIDNGTRTKILSFDLSIQNDVSKAPRELVTLPSELLVLTASPRNNDFAFSMSAPEGEAHLWSSKLARSTRLQIPNYVEILKFDETGQYLMGVSPKHILLWNGGTGQQEVREMKENKFPMTFAPDGLSFTTTDARQNIKLWRLR